MTAAQAGGELMTPMEVAQAFRVDAGTVKRWRKKGWLRAVRTPGGHHRYFAAQVAELLHSSLPEGPPP